MAAIILDKTLFGNTAKEEIIKEIKLETEGRH